MLKAGTDLALHFLGLTALVYAGLRLFEVDAPFAIAVFTYAVSVLTRKVLDS